MQCWASTPNQTGWPNTSCGRYITSGLAWARSPNFRRDLSGPPSVRRDETSPIQRVEFPPRQGPVSHRESSLGKRQ